MAIDGKHLVVPPDGGAMLPLGAHAVRYVYREAGAPYTVVEWLAPPAVPGPPIHIHRVTGQAFYVLEGTCGFQAGDETINGSSGSFVFVPRGLPHTY